MCKILHVACFTCVNLKTHHTASVTVGPESLEYSPIYVTPTFLLFSKLKWNALNVIKGCI